MQYRTILRATQYRTTFQNDALTTGEHAQIGTYVLASLSAQNAGSVPIGCQ
jgi:hypothetical protein